MGGKGNRGAPHQWKLWAQLFGRLGPVRLVEVVHLIAERVGRRVEDAGKMRRPLGPLYFLQQLEQHVAEAGHGADGQAVRRARKRGQGMEGAEDIGARVHQIEVAVLGNGGSGHEQGILCRPQV